MRCILCGRLCKSRLTSFGVPYEYCGNCKMSYEAKNGEPYKSRWCSRCHETVRHNMDGERLICRCCGHETRDDK